MRAATELLTSPELGDAIVSVAIVLAHAFSGAGLMLVASGSTPRDGSRSRAERVVLIGALALGLPAMTLAALTLATSSRGALIMTRDAFGLLPWSIPALTLVWLVSWSVRSTSRSERAARVAGWGAAGAAALAIAAGASLSAWCFHPADWLETRSLRSAMQSSWLVPMLVIRGAGAIAIGGAAAWALSAPRLDSRAARNTASVTTAAALAMSLCIGALCAVFAFRWFHDPWTGVPALAGPHGARATRLTYVALSASMFCAAVGAWAARSTPHQRFGPLATAALSMIAMFCFEQARAGSIRPWAVPGLLYANGTTWQQAHLSRRSARIDAPSTASREALGEAMFRLQCSSCHQAATSRARASERGFPEIRAQLDTLRDADQLGNPWRGVMPPLVGSDEEVDALARWLCGRP